MSNALIWFRFQKRRQSSCGGVDDDFEEDNHEVKLCSEQTGSQGTEKCDPIFLLQLLFSRKIFSLICTRKAGMSP